MSSIRNIKLGPRLIGTFLLATALTVLEGGFGLYNLRQADARSSTIYHDNTEAIRDLAEVQKHLILHARTLVRALTQVSNKEAQNATITRAEGYWKTEQEKWREYMQTPATVDEKDLQDQLQAELPTYIRLSQQAIAELRGNNFTEAMELINGPVLQSSKKMETLMDQLITTNFEQAAASNAANEEQSRRATWITWAVIAGGTLFAFVGGSLITRSITLPIQEAVNTANRIANKDLTRIVEVTGTDEVSILSNALHGMQQGLRSTLGVIAGSSGQLAAASEELNVVTRSMSQTINASDDQLHMAVAAVTEMSVAVDEVARSAAASSQFSESAADKTRQGRAQVGETRTAIADLTTHISQATVGVNHLVDQIGQVSAVLDVIGAIAEQTNLLALNAAIEAARAGEQGRGFSVVADEVRALAGRTQASTREIAEIIQSVKTASATAATSMSVSSEKAEATRKLADAADKALEHIAVAIDQINAMNVTVASATEEQVATARDVDRNLVTIKAMSAQNATAALQVNASSNDLARIAGELNGMVSAFRV